LEIIGAAAILGLLGWFALKAVFAPFKDFAGGACTDTELNIQASPDAAHTLKTFHRECGSNYDFYFVYLSTGNPNPGYEYTPIVELKNLAPGSASVKWDRADQITVTYPSSATVVDAYAKTFGVRVVLNPPVQ
jgi:hypothetical protein